MGHLRQPSLSYEAFTAALSDFTTAMASGDEVKKASTGVAMAQAFQRWMANVEGELNVLDEAVRTLREARDGR